MRERSTAKLTLAATAVMMVIGTVAGIGIERAGDALLYSPGAETRPVAETAAGTILELRTTPAENALTATLSTPPAGWAGTGEIQRSEAAPPPYSCPLPGKAPAAALSRTFSTSGTAVKVTLTAYTAGLGAEAINELNSAFERCAGAGASPGWDRMYGQTPGAEAYIASVTRSGNPYRTASFRRGDVIAYVSGTADFGTLQSLSVSLDNTLAGNIDPVCIDTGSTPEQSARSLWAAAAYKPFRVDVPVKIKDPGLPAATGPKAIAPVSIPGPALEGAAPVQPAEVPDYPVWPVMPEPVPLPQEPLSPSPAPKLTAGIRTLAPDQKGPGCGWAFTGTSAPVFDAVAAEKKNREDRTAAAAKLSAGAKEWSSAVLQYWKDYASYAKEVKTYSAYAAKVNEVNEAWNGIAADWADYYVLAEEYAGAVTAKADFTARQKEAEAEFDARILECASRPDPVPTPAPSPSPTPEPTPSPGSTGSPSPSPSPSPTATPEPEPAQEPCDTSRPEILDQQAPEVPVEPSEPADPRPADKR